MPTVRSPRHGSMQYWPRRRAKKETAKVRYWAPDNNAKLLGFAGYKVGMTHIIIKDDRKTSTTKGEDISCPVTVIECPPIKTASIRFYKKIKNRLSAISDVVASNLDKDLSKTITIPKKINIKIEDIKEYDDIRIVVYTQPKLTGIGKKKPELFEMGIGGSKEEKLEYAKSVLGKEIKVEDILSPGQQLDVHAVTKGKGFQGPVKRFGIGIRAKKSEKTKRGPGSLGGWKAQGHFMYRVAHAGQMGYHLRTEYNKWLVKIGNNPAEINLDKGFTNYGIVKNDYILVKGSVAGARKRLIRINAPIRANPKILKDAPTIKYVSLK